MSTPELCDLYVLCAAAGVRVHVADDGTLKAGPAKSITPAIRAGLNAHRANLTDPRRVCDPIPPDPRRYPVVPVREGGVRVLVLPDGASGVAGGAGRGEG